MKLTQKLAYSQIKANRGRSFWTLAGIALSTVMITAVFGFAASGDVMVKELIGSNDFYLNSYRTTLFGISAVFISIIVITSVIVVSNAFRVSAGERTAQFGILKSVGATKKQIAKTIMYEGLYLCIIGIPVGIGLGLLVNLSGIQIANHFLARINEAEIELNFVFAWQAILLSIIVSSVMVCLSAWLPARKAANISAIDAIRKTDEVKIKAKQVRSNWLVGKLFGIEGELASKSLKRSGRNFRATVISLTISIMLFITVGAFGTQINTMADLFWIGIDANVGVAFNSPIQITREDESNEITDWQTDTIESSLANDITEKLREYPNTEIFGAGSDDFGGFTMYYTVLPKEMLTAKMQEAHAPPPEYAADIKAYSLSVRLVSVDAENYALLCKKAGVPVGSNLLVNQYTWYQDSGRTVFAPYVFEEQTLRLTNQLDNREFDLPLHGEISEQDIPSEVIFAASGDVSVIVPNMPVAYYCWFASTDDKDGFAKYASEVMNEYLPQVKKVKDVGEVEATVEIMDLEADTSSMRTTADMVMVFIYGFVGLLTLIGLTNVISTISMNVRTRSREFAVLRSVGMTSGGLKRMLSLESILCSVKSLVIGVPLGIIGAYISYTSLDLPAEFGFALPWLPILECVIGVLAVTWVTMRFSANQIRHGNVIEAIHQN
ncbi:MAG: ABC transporter permease [Oscillospiraceae bacterium]|nr:ABC transporter permease [Oscillospiraceae bacterium]